MTIVFALFADWPQNVKKMYSQTLVMYTIMNRISHNAQTLRDTDTLYTTDAYLVQITIAI